ncbi:MAG TPA: DNA-packaging protein [Ruminococcus sp.]|nr:DNA-packaging protein [Ruminococcus sp.]
MTDSEKIAMVTTMTSETDTNVLSTYLVLGKDAVLKQAFPFGDYPEEFPEQYDVIHVKITAYLLNKRGAEGETMHNENGVSRSYADGDIPPSLLREIIPKAVAL